LTIDKKYYIDGSGKSGRHHSLIDFGEEKFTSARPHPIIDPSLRLSRLMEEANDASISVIMMDIIAGYSVPENNVELYAEAIAKAIALAGKKNRTLPIFCYVCGTEKDMSRSEIQALRDAGAQVFSSNALMSIAAGIVVKKNVPPTRLDSIMRKYLGVGIVE
jgi:hypothetical protein